MQLPSSPRFPLLHGLVFSHAPKKNKKGAVKRYRIIEGKAPFTVRSDLLLCREKKKPSVLDTNCCGAEAPPPPLIRLEEFLIQRWLFTPSGLGAVAYRRFKSIRRLQQSGNFFMRFLPPSPPHRGPFSVRALFPSATMPPSSLSQQSGGVTLPRHYGRQVAVVPSGLQYIVWLEHAFVRRTP